MTGSPKFWFHEFLFSFFGFQHFFFIKPLCNPSRHTHQRLCCLPSLVRVDVLCDFFFVFDANGTLAKTVTKKAKFFSSSPAPFYMFGGLLALKLIFC